MAPGRLPRSADLPGLCATAVPTDPRAPGSTMSTDSGETQCRFEELAPGDRIEIEHLVTVGQKSWTTKTAGKVVRTERRRHGLHHRRNVDDKVFSDVILLELGDGELTTVTVDEFTVVRRA